MGDGVLSGIGWSEMTGSGGLTKSGRVGVEKRRCVGWCYGRDSDLCVTNAVFYPFSQEEHYKLIFQLIDHTSDGELKVSFRYVG